MMDDCDEAWESYIHMKDSGGISPYTIFRAGWDGAMKKKGER